LCAFMDFSAVIALAASGAVRKRRSLPLPTGNGSTRPSIR
jgi:hypothetical protein